MQAIILNANHSRLDPADLHAMLRLRHEVFHERLRWDVAALEGRERDAYDDLDPVYALLREGGDVLGCCRLLPTTRAYMLRDTFPQLLGGRAAPQASSIWEISRFAVRKAARPGFAFSAPPAALIRAVARFALDRGIREYVCVTTVAFERLLLRMGVHCERFAPPETVGCERSVALRIFVDARTARATGADCELRLVPPMAAPVAHAA